MLRRLRNFGKLVKSRRAISKMMAVVIVVIVVVAAAVGAYYWLALAPTEEAPDEILVGGHFPLTGYLGRDGYEHKLGGDLAVWVINELWGGIYVEEYDKKLPIKWICYDDESDSSKAVSAMERLITVDGVPAICGGYGSSIVYMSSTVAEKNKIPYVAIGAVSEPIYQRGYKYLFQTMGGLTLIMDRTCWEYWAKWRDEHPEVELKTAYLIHDTTMMPTEHTKGSIASAMDNGFEVIGVESFELPATDFTPILTKIKAADPDIVCQSTYLEGNLLFAQQLREMDINPKIVFINVGTEMKVFEEGLGTTANDCWGHSAYEVEFEQYPGYEDFWDALEDFNNRGIECEGNSFTATTYEGFMVLADAIERAGSLDPQEIRDALIETNMTTVCGPVWFDPVFQWNYRPWIAFQIIDGARVAFWPEEFAKPGAEPVIPFTPWDER